MTVVLSLYKGLIDVDRDPAPEGGMKGMLAEVAAYYGLKPSDLQCLSRRHEITIPRQAFMWRCRQIRWADGRHRYSLPLIGRFLGGMDHTTVLHGVRAHEKRLAQVSEAA